MTLFNPKTNPQPTPSSPSEGSAKGIGQRACQYCSVVSKANGEDPIGTAITAQQWLMIEVPQPWAKNPWANQSADLLALFERIERQPKLWKALRILAIAPDKTNSTKRDRHVFFYRQPQGAASEYAQQHYHLPTGQLSELVQALVLQPAEIARFAQYLQPRDRALFICTHTNYDLACGRFGTPLYRTLRKHYTQPAIQTDIQPDLLSVWQTTHFGGHNFAPTLIDFPLGQFWGHLEPDILDMLIHRQGNVSDLQPFYRGWSGFSKWAQIAERALWMQQGWDWLATPKSARIIRQDPGKLSHRLLRWGLPWIPTIRAQILLKQLLKKLTWAEVEICWEASNGRPPGRYRARVEASHTVISQTKSSASSLLMPVPQYRVIELETKTTPDCT